MLSIEDYDLWRGLFTYTKEKGGLEALGPESALRAFKSRAGLVGHDASGRIVVYRDGYWQNDEEWLNAILAAGLGDMWTDYVRKTYLKFFVSCTPEISAVVGDWLNFKNGLYNWRTNEWVAHSPEKAGTIQFGCELHIGATDADRPNWTEYLATKPEPDAVGVLQEWTGYSLTWGNPYRKALMTYGPTGSGKSSYLDVIQALLGEENCSSTGLHELSTNRFTKADLFGVTANVCGEIEGKEIKTAADFKGITSGDVIRAERKGEPMFRFRPQAKLMFSANELPKSVDKSEAWVNRWLFMPFPNTTSDEEQTEDYVDNLIAELPAIAWWAIEGLQRLKARGYFERSESILKLSDEYRVDNDTVLQFLEECYVKTPAGGRSLKGAELFDHYMSWFISNHVGHLPEMGIRDFYKRVEAVWKPRKPKIAGGTKYYGMARIDEIAGIAV